MENVTIALLFVSTASVVFIFFKPSKIKNYPSQGDTIIMFGDSLTVGVGASEGKSIPELLSKKIHKPVIGMGVRGETSAQGLARIEKVIEKYPKVVLVLIGGNDYLQEVPIEETFKNIDAIVKRIQDAGAVVVLLGIQGGILSDPFEEQFKKISKNRGALYVKNVLDGIIGEEDLMFDEVHPNDKGYERIVKKILPVLKKGL
jgi:acyl-CoA thioesterase-1